jgi:hypothetical protein
MKKANGSWRSLVATGLVGGMLALPVSHAVAGQQQQYPPFAPSAPQEEQEEGPSTAAKWFGAALLGGLLWCAWTDCIGGGNSGGSAPRWKEEERPQKPAYARPDTSIGCRWGDRAHGTCVK